MMICLRTFRSQKLYEPLSPSVRSVCYLVAMDTPTSKAPKEPKSQIEPQPDTEIGPLDKIKVLLSMLILLLDDASCLRALDMPCLEIS